MGAKHRNFHMELMGRMGYEAEADEIQELFFEGKRDEAIRRCRPPSPTRSRSSAPTRASATVSTRGRVTGDDADRQQRPDRLRTLAELAA